MHSADFFQRLANVFREKAAKQPENCTIVGGDTTRVALTVNSNPQKAPSRGNFSV